MSEQNVTTSVLAASRLDQRALDSVLYRLGIPTECCGIFYLVAACQ